MHSRHRHPLRFLEKITEQSYATLLLLWANLVLGFAAVYFALTHLAPLHGLREIAGQDTWTQMGDSLYFSVVTATTVGYGDIIAQGAAKGFAALEAILGFLLFGILVAKLVGYRHEVSLQQIHKMSFENIFHHTREGFYIIRRDFEAIMKEADGSRKLSPKAWENLSVAYREGQSLLEGIPDFYNDDDHFYTIDVKREKLLLEAVHRTVARLRSTLEGLTAATVDWRGHRESFHELKRFVETVDVTIAQWKKKSPYRETAAFAAIRSENTAVRTMLKR